MVSLEKKERRRQNAEKRGKHSTHHIICRSRKELFQNLESAMNKYERDEFNHGKYH